MDEFEVDFKEYEEVESYGKLEGPGIKQFIFKLVIYLGRENSGINPENESEQIVFVGDSQKISRRHAKIYWSFESNQWEIQILSKNKVIVNGAVIRKGDPPMVLIPCAAIKIDKYKFYFFPARKD